MQKVNVFIVDNLDHRILLTFARVGRKKAGWIAKRWAKHKVIQTSVLICDSEIDSPASRPQPVALQSPTLFC